MTTELKKSIGRRVQAARKQAAITQEELAGWIERSPEAVSNIERGVSLPTIDTLERIARALSVPLVFFFDTLDEALPPRRTEVEARARLIFRQLSDRDADIALGVLEVLRDGGRRQD